MCVRCGKEMTKETGSDAYRALRRGVPAAMEERRGTGAGPSL